MKTDAESLEANLVRCARGERDALRAIFDGEGGRMLAVSMRILKRRDLAEEAMQDAFVQIWTKAHQFAPDRGSAQGWIVAIVRNRALNMLRDGKREEATDDDSLSRMAEKAGFDEAQAAYSTLDASSRLRACLSALDETKRKCILMTYVSGYTHGEVAGRLDVPLGTAKAWIRRGLARSGGAWHEHR